MHHPMELVFVHLFNSVMHFVFSMALDHPMWMFLPPHVNVLTSSLKVIVSNNGNPLEINTRIKEMTNHAGYNLYPNPKI